MTDFKLEYDLVQQTPMIHFQHYQQGATLRASEVKPKLDKFIIAECGGFDKVYDANPEWFVGYTKQEKAENEKKQKEDISKKPALNYKMRFFAGQFSVEEPPKFGLYYGNMGAKTENDKAKYVIGNTKLSILCFNTELADTIKKNIREFFVVTNFGRMNDKGFGSYIIPGKYDEAFIGKALCKASGAKECYCFSCSCHNDKTKEEIFKKIKTLYSVMKSGFNINGSYHRSFLFEYFHELNVGNEKAYMKKEKMSPYSEGKPVEYPGSDRKYSDWNDDEYRYVRAVLGVGEKVEYITGFTKNTERNRYFPNREKLQLLISSEEIERFPSPVFFKVINDKVYYVGKRINDKILNREFTFKIKPDRNVPFDAIEVDQSKTVVLKTPKEFDIDAFLKYFYDNYNPYAKGYGINTRLERHVIGGDNI